MLRFDAVLRRRARLVVAAWVVLLVAAVPFALHQSDHLTGGGFSVPGSQAKAVEDGLAAGFPPSVSRATLAVVAVPRPGAQAADVRAALRRVRSAADRVAKVDVPAGAVPAALHANRRAPRRPLVLPLAVETDEFGSSDVAADLRKALDLDAAQHGPVALHLIGQGALWAGLQDQSKSDLSSAERAGFPIVLLILLAVFGSLAAAALPLVLGAVSVLVTGAIIYWLSSVMEMSVFVTNMSSMIGIGVAVDYSLFVLARYREEIAKGATADEARATAMATSGLAVLFSGLTVIVSLAGLYMVNTTAIRSMALGAILVVAVSMLASATLLPVLIRLLGERAHRPGRVLGRLVAARDATPFWTRWASRVMRRPVVSLVLAASLLVALAVPALGLKTGDGALRQFPSDSEVRQGFEAAATVLPPGASSPVKVLAARGDTARIVGLLQRDPEVADVLAPVVSRDGRSVLVRAIPRHDGESKQAKALVDRVRAAVPAGTEVGGSSATQQDFRSAVDGSMWKIALFVLGLSYLVLMVLLRSVVLPLKAVVMNLLSVGASYGVLTIVFVWGWFDGFLGFQSPGYVDTITPPLVLAVVFGLSMDYEVFLLSRIRERHALTGDTRRAVAEGLSTSARTITSAALIMVGVFAVFVGTGLPSIKQLGLGNAVAIAVDATLVRLVLVPAAMELLGRWNWYLPRGLARLLPPASFEEIATHPARPEPAPAS